MSAEARNPGQPDISPRDASKPRRGERSQSAAAGEPLFTVEEVASQAALSKTSIRRAISSGELVAVRLGRSVRVRLSDWERYLEAHRIQGRPALVPPKKKRAAIAGAKQERPQ